MTATGATMRTLTRNLSLMLHPCVWVATMVVSLMKERLSPKYVPPTTTPTIRGMLMPDCWAMPTAKGVSAAMVPQLVPMLSEMKQEARKMPGRINCSGRYFSATFTVASTAPIVLAEAANAPARMKMASISTIVGFPAPLAKTLMRSFIVPLTVSRA